ncbi:unnamed protein product [Lasius platythorax]|uniref:Uncharacterized protein n=1 Tax=Lasius platythorax TaxID=488582 RepID=A0AAV2P0K5_9HYME
MDDEINADASEWCSIDTTHYSNAIAIKYHRIPGEIFAHESKLYTYFVFGPEYERILYEDTEMIERSISQLYFISSNNKDPWYERNVDVYFPQYRPHLPPRD